jgi:hypothetical protein
MNSKISFNLMEPDNINFLYLFSQLALSMAHETSTTPKIQNVAMQEGLTNTSPRPITGRYKIV